MSRNKKSKEQVNLNDIQQTHGSLTSHSPRSVEELLGLNRTYTSVSIAEYRKELEAMTDIDLHDHAPKVGVVPGVNQAREALIDRLERQFLHDQTKNMFKTVPTTLSPEAQKRHERFMRGASLS